MQSTHSRIGRSLSFLHVYVYDYIFSSTPLIHCQIPQLDSAHRASLLPTHSQLTHYTT